jgi:galactose-1-phosphate uridylyltransferase
VLLKEYPGHSIPFRWHGEAKEVQFVTRVDPLSGNVSKISVERAKRGIGISANLDIRPIRKCQFCHYQEFTPEDRLEHSCGAVSIPNLYPWERYDWITIYPPFGQHKVLLSELWFDDLEMMIESSYELASICARDPGVMAFMDFTNWGAFAGASQQHPHSQRRSITGVLDPQQDRELQRCKQIADWLDKNPFDLLAEEERQDGRRVIYDDHLLILAAFAPHSPNEVLVFPKEPLANILDTDQETRKWLVNPILGIFPALFFYTGVTDLNIAIHMAPFAEREAAREYYRWHMHIYPRRPTLPVDRAGAELGFETNVIDALPERCAEVLRLWYKEGPQEEHLARTPEGEPSPRLLQLFRRLTDATAR